MVEKARFTEAYHLAQKPEHVVGLYKKVNAFCKALSPRKVDKQYRQQYVGFRFNGETFCSVHVKKRGDAIRMWLRLDYADLDSPPSFARDVSGIGHWGRGKVELFISDASEFEASTELIRQSFQKVFDRDV